jgi:hypothetical protein
MSDDKKERQFMFPSHLFDEVKKSRIWVLENQDIVDQQDLERLLSIMFNYPEGNFFLYVPENESICPVIRKAMDSNLIIGNAWKRNFYPHPESHRDYVHVLPNNMQWGWEQELLNSAQEHLRFELTLSEAVKRKMQINQHLSAQQMADSNPIELKPNFMGFGIDLHKGWSWIRKKLRF